MIQRLGRVIRLKDDGRAARLVVLYAIDTVEDPGVEAMPDHLADTVAHAAAVERFTLPGDEDRLMGFLVPTASGGSRRAG